MNCEPRHGEPNGAAGAGAAVPQRYWWLRRIALGCVLLMLAMVATHLLWGWVAKR